MSETMDLVIGIAQILSAIATTTIAVVAYNYTRKSSRMSFIVDSTKMLNDVNNTFLSSEKTVAALAKIRTPISGDFHLDYVILTNLNYLHATWMLRNEEVISPELADAKLANGSTFFLNFERDAVERLLRRGFPETFRVEMLEHYDAAVSKETAEQSD
ncbi:MAG: hypothetical protein AAF661_09700 [Pseudomonadota bacterium]